MELKQKARDLRSQGLTYKQIVEALDGAVSIDWCKRQLKGSSHKSNDDNTACIQEVITLGKRPEGVTHYEANGVIYKHFPNANEYKLRYIKDRAKIKGEDVIVHTGWIDHMKPNESHKAMNAFVLHLMDQVDLMVEDYIELFPNANKWSVRHEMLTLAFSDKISNISLNNRIYTNELVAERMEDRTLP